jgi:hypothetical protein
MPAYAPNTRQVNSEIKGRVHTVSEATASFNENPEITKLLLWVTGIESFVLLVAGVGLLLFPSVVGPEWPWELTRFNALLLGSIYSAALVATVITVRVHHWAPARIVLPMIALFTTVVLVVSLINFDRFESGKYSTWLWFLLYVVIPANAIFHMWLYRHLKPYRPFPLSNKWQAILLLPTIALGLYGIGLLIAPATFADFWPWPVDDFHGRMYSVAYLTPALGALLLVRAAAAIEAFTLGLTMAAGGIVPIVGLAIIDIQTDKIDWSQGGTWLWIASFAILFLAGLGLAWRSRFLE